MKFFRQNIWWIRKKALILQCQKGKTTGKNRKNPKDKRKLKLPCGVMVARRFLAPLVRVRVLPRQQRVESSDSTLLFFIHSSRQSPRTVAQGRSPTSADADPART